MIRFARPLTLVITAVTSLAAFAVPRNAFAQGACCLQSGGCVNVLTVPECNGLGGVLLAGEDCNDAPCGLGACCHDLDCLQAAAWECIAGGRTFAGAGISCLEDPCEAGVGACCFTDGSCQFIGPDPCATAGGTWLGAGTNCDSGGACVLGVCCLPGDCLDAAGFECNAMGGTFIAGGDCALDACDVSVACPLDALYGQEIDGPNFFTAYTSESSAGFSRFDNFEGVPGAIDGVRFWGLQADLSSGDFVPCTETAPIFTIAFHEPSPAGPGPLVCTYTVGATRTPTGQFYQGFQLIEFEAALPAPCALVDGWISIVGEGDAACWFLWMSAIDGNGLSWCTGCASSQEGDDLAFCLLGSAGGVFGACCDQSSGLCVDTTEIVDCIGTGLRFVPDADCADLVPLCAPELAACCRPDGTCTLELPADCTAFGGEWLGPGTSCDDCPAFGACCIGFETCVETSEPDCIAAGNTWLGPDTSCGDCPQPPECPAGSLFAQTPEGPDGFEAGTSEQSAGFSRFEDFAGLTGPVDEVVWWGLDMDFLGGSTFVDCTEADPTFIIAFHEDAGGAPGLEVCSYTLLATRTPTNIFYFGVELNEYRVVLPTPCTLVDGWVSIVGLGDPECWFLWMSSAIGDSWCAGCTPAPQDLDFSVCLVGTAGGVFGACCNDATGQCADGVEISSCTSANLRFEPDTTCAALDPPCGVILGACCLPDATCSIVESPDCATAGGNWLGADTLCDQCPCVVPCPAGATNEGEPDCFDGYVDTFNGGCDSSPPVYRSIMLDETVCGTNGAYLVDFDAIPDTDWYELVLPGAVDLAWTVTAEFPVIAVIADGASGCPPDILAFGQGGSCEEVRISSSAGPGPVWLVVQASTFSDETACPAAYTATAAIDIDCPADVNDDGTVDVTDLVAVILAWGGSDPSADVDGSGIVDVGDLVEVIIAWGDCGT